MFYHRPVLTGGGMKHVHPSVHMCVSIWNGFSEVPGTIFIKLV